MTIHHDKLAYGKLAATSEDLSEERLAKMLAELNGPTENIEDMADAANSAGQTENSADGENAGNGAEEKTSGKNL